MHQSLRLQIHLVVCLVAVPHEDLEKMQYLSWPKHRTEFEGHWYNKKILADYTSNSHYLYDQFSSDIKGKICFWLTLQDSQKESIVWKSIKLSAIILGYPINSNNLAIQIIYFNLCSTSLNCNDLIWTTIWLIKTKKSIQMWNYCLSW